MENNNRIGFPLFGKVVTLERTFGFDHSKQTIVHKLPESKLDVPTYSATNIVLNHVEDLEQLKLDQKYFMDAFAQSPFVEDHVYINYIDYIVNAISYKIDLNDKKIINDRQIVATFDQHSCISSIQVSRNEKGSKLIVHQRSANFKILFHDMHNIIGRVSDKLVENFSQVTWVIGNLHYFQEN